MGDRDIATGTVVQLLCKAPIEGTVKTRLAKRVGVQRATALHIEMMNHAISTISAVPDTSPQIWCAPDTGHRFFDQFRHDMALFAQQGENLGERMSNALETALTDHGSVILIGSDCPVIDVGYIESAVSKLVGFDAVIGPAEDGGFGLIGLTRFDSALFDQVSWSTSAAFTQTFGNMVSLGWKVAVLDTIWDVDRPEDVDRYDALKAYRAGTCLSG